MWWGTDTGCPELGQIPHLWRCWRLDGALGNEVKGVYAHGRGIGTRWPLSFLPTQTFLSFFEEIYSIFFSYFLTDLNILLNWLGNYEMCGFSNLFTAVWIWNFDSMLSKTPFELQRVICEAWMMKHFIKACAVTKVRGLKILLFPIVTKQTARRNKNKRDYLRYIVYKNNIKGLIFW